jgi:hypothetical protein
LSCVDYLQKLNKKKNVLFFATLIPYQRVHLPKKYGIINGMPDFYIAKKAKIGNKYTCGLFIELKSLGPNRILTNDEYKVIKNIEKEGDYSYAVVYGYKKFRTLVRKYVNGKLTKEELDKFNLENMVLNKPKKKSKKVQKSPKKSKKIQKVQKVQKMKGRVKKNS